MKKIINNLEKKIPTWIKYLILFALSFISIKNAIRLLQLSNVEYPIWMWPLVEICFFSYFKFVISKKCTKKIAFVFSLLLIFFQMLGKKFDIVLEVDYPSNIGDFYDYLYCISCSFLLTPLLAWPLSENLDYYKKIV